MSLRGLAENEESSNIIEVMQDYNNALKKTVNTNSPALKMTLQTSAMCTLKAKRPPAVGDKVLFPSHPYQYLMKGVFMVMDQQAFSQMKQDHSSE
jgi:hypothetical protein